MAAAFPEKPSGTCHPTQALGRRPESLPRHRPPDRAFPGWRAYLAGAMQLVIEKIDTFGGHRDAVIALTPGPQPGQFFSAGADGLLIGWHTGRPDLGQLLARIRASVYALAFDPTTGLLWAGQNYEGIQRIDPQTRQSAGSLRLTNAAIFAIQFHEDTAFVAFGDGTLAVLDRPAFAVRKHLRASQQAARCMAVNTALGELAVGYSDAFIRIFDLDTLALKATLAAHRLSVFTLAYTPDGQRLLSGSRDAHLRAWDAAGGYTPLHDVPAHLFALNKLALQPGGPLLATASMDKSVKLWNAQTLQLLKVLDRARHAGHGTSVNTLLWLDDYLISGGDDRLISVWKVGV